jgi:hypothetical protein
MQIYKIFMEMFQKLQEKFYKVLFVAIQAA